jgi:hypothetical protein
MCSRQYTKVASSQGPAVKRARAEPSAEALAKSGSWCEEGRLPALQSASREEARDTTVSYACQHNLGNTATTTVSNGFVLTAASQACAVYASLHTKGTLYVVPLVVYMTAQRTGNLTVLLWHSMGVLSTLSGA